MIPSGSSSQLSVKLGHLLNIPPLSIELLPGDGAEWLSADVPAEARHHAPFLHFEGNLGVPQKLAYKAYLESVPMFRRCRARLRARRAASASSELTEAEIVETLASTAVLLLVNPAHQSALNVRKQLVQQGVVNAAHELCFTSALLTLHEGAKQSLLWHHRRWLLRRIYPRDGSTSGHPATGEEEDSLQDLALDADAFRTEFAVVARACEVYPRNYHAWTHRFLCAEALVSLIQTQGREVLVDVWTEERTRIREWIERHVSDYSAMQYACRLDVLAREVYASDPEQKAPEQVWAMRTEDGESACEHAWSLVQAYPSHESLWLYLRGALSLSLSHAAEAQLAGPSTARREARTFAERVLKGGTAAEDGAGGLEGGAFGERVQVRRHAVRFLAWLRWREGALNVDERIVRGVAAEAEGEEVLDLMGTLLGSTSW
ncbi:protein prenylyltransferase [Trametes cingulata]|nr:protein prenylyltransferase [Trametes cingulata]